MNDHGNGGLPVLDDLVQPFQIDAFGLRGRLVRLGGAFERCLRGHGYPDSVTEILGEAVALGTTLSSALKYDGRFTLQVQSDGPVNLVVADITSRGGVRGYARFDEDTLPDAEAAAGEPVPRLIGNGHLAFTVDQGPDTERYQGITDLSGGTLAQCAHNYFRQSEQLETAIVLAARPAAGGSDAGAKHAGAAALMVQRLPGPGRGPVEEEADEQWREAVILLSSIRRDELLDPDLSPADVLYRLYHAEGVRLYEPRPLAFECRCSQRRVERTLASFPREEVEEMKDDHGRVVVTCEFCKTEYPFDDAALDALYG